MGEKTEEVCGRRDEIIERASLMKEKVREGERGASPHGAILLIDSYLWSMRRSTLHEKAYSRKKKEERLKELQEMCSRAHEQVENLRRAVIDIPLHAPLRDEHSVDSLSVLLNHEDAYVRKAACRSIGLLGGQRARSVLENVARTGDIEMRQVAADSMLFCDTLELTEKLDEERLSEVENGRKKTKELEKTVGEMWTSEEVDVAVRIAVQPYKKMVKTVFIVILLVMCEILLAAAFVLVRSTQWRN